MAARGVGFFEFDRLLSLGAGVLAVSLIPAGIVLSVGGQGVDRFPEVAESIAVATEQAICLPIREDFQAIDLQEARDQISFSIDPPRPSGASVQSSLLVRLGGSRQSRRLVPPCAVGLAFSDSGSVVFDREDSPFKLEIGTAVSGEWRAKLFCGGLPGLEPVLAEWTIIPTETPFSHAEEFAEGTPFRQLAECRWWGSDQVREKYGDGQAVQRIEIGAGVEPLFVGAADWLIYEEGKWKKRSKEVAPGEVPIARVLKVRSSELEIEGWDGPSHLKLSIPLMPQPQLRTKPEELFARLRVRSDKQVSCTLDKQCLILRPGDWVVKLDQRWKILRNDEDKKAFLEGGWSGELFVLEKIDAKGPVKSIGGRFFSAARSQSVPIEYAAPSARAHKGKKGDPFAARNGGRVK